MHTTAQRAGICAHTLWQCCHLRCHGSKPQRQREHHAAAHWRADWAYAQQASWVLWHAHPRGQHRLEFLEYLETSTHVSQIVEPPVNVHRNEDEMVLPAGNRYLLQQCKTINSEDKYPCKLLL